MSWITDKLLGLRQVFFGGEQLPERGALEFTGDGVEVEDDAVNKRTVVTVAGGGPDVSIVGSGEIGVAESPAGTFTVSSPLLDGLATRTLTLHKLFDDETDGEELTEIPLSGPLGAKYKLTGAYVISSIGLAADDTNYAFITVKIRSSVDGSSSYDLVTATSSLTGPYPTGNWGLCTKTVLPAIDSVELYLIEEYQYLTLSITKAGPSGVNVPRGLFVVTLEPWVEEEE